MKRLLLILLGLVALIAAPSVAKAQDYGVGLSANMGASVGVGVKYFVSSREAIETSFAYNIGAKAPMFVGVYQYHIPLAAGLNLYAGGGINIGAIHTGKNRVSEFAFGIDPTVGFEYTFENAPIALALDYRPAINLTCAKLWDEVAFKVRFVF